jgi:hypothetical protein
MLLLGDALDLHDLFRLATRVIDFFQDSRLFSLKQGYTIL